MSNWYVSPTGSSSNSGAIASPWSFAYAAAGAAGSIQPGDTVWLRGGTYNDPDATSGNSDFMFDITVDGTAGNPITFRGYPGELPVVSDHRGNLDNFNYTLVGIWVRGDYLILRDLVFTCTYTTREYDVPGPYPRGGTPYLASKDGKTINCISHDTDLGFFLSANGTGAQEHVGAITYNYGQESVNAGIGHSLYTQSAAGDTKLVEDCVFAGGYGYNFHAYTTLDNNLDGFTVKNCTSIDGFVLTNFSVPYTGNTGPGGGDQWGGSSGGKPMSNLVIDGHFYTTGMSVADLDEYPTEIRVRNSYFVGTPGLGGSGCRFRGVKDLREFKNNTLARFGGNDPFPAIFFNPADDSGLVTTITPADPSDFDNNAYYFGEDPYARAVKNEANVYRTLAEWQADTGWDLNSTASTDGSPPPPFSDVVANPAETGRGTVRMFKPAATTSMAVDLNTILDPGQQYWLYDARNPLDGAFATGQFTGADVTVTFADMPGRAVPVGWSSAPVGQQATHPVVIVRRVGPEWVAPPVELTDGSDPVLLWDAHYRFRVILT